MALEQTVKDLRAQNAQFQQMLLNLAKGQEELKTLITKERKKKTRKPIGILNMGRRFIGPIKKTQYCDIPLNEDDNQGEDGKSVKSEKESNLGSGQYSYEDEEEYSDKQYPPADEKTNSWKIV